MTRFDEISYVIPDREVRTLGHVSATTGADLVRNQATGGLDGMGIGIAVLDSGIDNSHKSFRVGRTTESDRRIVAEADFVGYGNASDQYGHGTHVASLAGGNGRIANAGYVGIAPNADIINLRVLDNQGRGTVSSVLLALDWVLANRAAYNIRVVNMSLGMPAIDSYRNDPVCLAVRRLVDAGIVVAAAAGNNGKTDDGQKVYGQIHSPGIEPSAITVGATNTFGTNARGDDTIATYSSRGPTRGSYLDASGVRRFDNLIKPELVAPGNKLVAAQSEGECPVSHEDCGAKNYLLTLYPEMEAGVSTDDSRAMMFMSGTSMSAPRSRARLRCFCKSTPGSRRT